MKFKEFEQAGEYRDELAEKLKEIRNSDEKNRGESTAKAEGYLEAKRETPEYQKAKEGHKKDIAMEERRKHGLRDLIESSNDGGEAINSLIETVKEMRELGLVGKFTVTRNWDDLRGHIRNLDGEPKEYDLDNLYKEYGRRISEFKEKYINAYRSTKKDFDDYYHGSDNWFLDRRSDESTNRIMDDVNHEVWSSLGIDLTNRETPESRKEGYGNFLKFAEKFKKTPEMIEQEARDEEEKKKKKAEIDLEIAQKKEELRRLEDQR